MQPTPQYVDVLHNCIANPNQHAQLHFINTQVVCAYHGWRFQADGSCSSIPQALDPKAAATACASSRGCATAFPTKAAGGLLWVWPDTAPTAGAEADGEPVWVWCECDDLGVDFGGL